MRWYFVEEVVELFPGNTFLFSLPLSLGRKGWVTEDKKELDGIEWPPMALPWAFSAKPREIGEIKQSLCWLSYVPPLPLLCT